MIKLLQKNNNLESNIWKGMKNMNKRIKYFLSLLLVIAILPLGVKAKGITLSTDKKELKSNDTVTITAKLDYDDKLYAFLAGLSFDENVFETPEVSNFKEQDGWSDIVYNKENKKFALLNKSGEVDSNVFIVKLVVKEAPVSGETEISLKNMAASDGKEDITFDNASTILKVTNTSGKEATATYSKDTESSNNTKKVKSNKPFIIIGSIASIILIIGIIWNVSKNNKKAINVILGGLLIISIATTGLLLINNRSKGDVNQDGNKDYLDAKKINEYLIDITTTKEEDKDNTLDNEENKEQVASRPNKTTDKNSNNSNNDEEVVDIVIVKPESGSSNNKEDKEENNTNNNDKDKDKDNNNDKDLPNLDVNDDGEITITDSANQTQNTTEKTKYKVELQKLKINNYPSDLELNFKATINPNDVKIKYVYLNDKKVQVTNTNDGYQVITKTPNKAGINKYTISKVVLTNGKEITIKDLVIDVDVLKDIPEIKEVTSINNKLNIKLNDKDKSFKKLNLKIVEGIVKIDEFNNKKTIFEKNLDVSKDNTLDTNLEYGKTYTILITGDYDLDSNNDTKSNYYKDKQLYFGSFVNGEVTIKGLTDLENLYPNTLEDINFEFEASIEPKTMNQTIAKAIIDGKEYPVTIKDNHYVVKLERNDTPGVKKHTLSAFVLGDNNKILCNYEIKYEVLKNAFEFKDFMYHNVNNKITFTLEDKDRTLKNAEIIITSEGKEVFKEELDILKTNFEYQVNLEKGAKYQIKINGSYDLDSNNNNQKNDYNGSLFTYDLTIYDVNLSQVKDTYYVNKNEEFELKFKADVVPNDAPFGIINVLVNDEHYIPTSYEDNTYGIMIAPSKNAGIKEYKISKVTLGDNKLDKELNIKVDVLKDKPTLEEFIVDETGKRPIINFKLKDKDNALKDDLGEAIIKDGNSEIERIAIKKNKTNNYTIDLNDIEQELEHGKTYYVDIKVNYDLDSDINNGFNEATETLVTNHEIKIYDAKLELASNTSYYVSKDTENKIYINGTIKGENEVKIKSFIFDDQQEVMANYENDLYYFNIKTPNKTGIVTYNIEEIVLTNDVKVKAPLEFSLDVLKDIPYINKVNLSDDNKSLSYELVDHDKAFKGGTVIILDKDNKKVVETVVDDKEPLEYDFKDGEKYQIKIIGSYDLDTIIDDNNNNFKDIEMYNHSFIIGGEYNFTLSEVGITDAIWMNDDVKITFTSTNTRGAKVSKVTLNNKEYEVKEESPNNYEVIMLDANKAFGSHEVTFDSITLDTLKTYKNKEDYNVNPLTYTILKTAPSITNIKLTNNPNKIINVKFNLKDDNSALTNLKVLLVSSSDTIISSKELTIEEIYELATKDGIDLSYDKNFDGKYSVRFIADYKLGDKYHFNNQKIGEDEIFTQGEDIYIDEVTLKKDKYVTKNLKNYEISYDVYVSENIKTSNNKSYTRLSMVTVNGTNYIPNGESTTKPRIYKGKIGITTPNEAGVYTLVANRVQLELNTYYDKQNNYYSVPDKKIQIEVLKDIPKIENLKITNENYQDKTVTFEFDVKLDSTAKANDESLIDGSIILGNELKRFERGHNKIEFTNVKTDEKLNLIFKASYDLDSDTIKEDTDLNEYHDALIYETVYGLYDSNNYNDLEVLNGKAISKDNDNYFDKNEIVKVNFNLNKEIDDLTLEKVIVKDKEYNVTKLESGYEFSYGSYNTFGLKEIEIDGIILSNGKTIKLEKTNKIKLEVLKDKPSITNYKYEVSDDKIKITSKLNDNDAAIIDEAKVTITNDREEVVLESPYKEEITIKKDKSVRYYIKIKTSYDLDIDNKDNQNYYEETLLDEIISLDTNNIELKDINDINLYKMDNEEIKLIDKIKVSELDKNKDDYFVEINMDNMPSIRTKILEVKEESGNLVLVLDYQYVTLENSNLSYLKLEFGEIKDGVATNEIHPKEAFLALLQKLKNNEDVTLNRNYDASSIADDEALTYVDSYSKTFDGNGFTIKNLKKPLFNTLDGATIKNLTLSDVTMPAQGGNGTLAIKANNSNILNVIVENYYKPNNEGGVGVLIGTATSSTIKESAAINFNIYAGWNNLQQIGGLVGSGNTLTIENCYANGKIPGGWNFRGGLVGNANNVTFLNNYAKVEINYGMGDNLVFDFAAGSNNIYKNNLSLTTGFNHRFTGMKESSNNYYVDDSTNDDINQEGLTRIRENAINKELFTNLGFSDTIWNLDNVSKSNLPIFKYQKLAEFNKVESIKFDEAKIVLYNNLKKLMPFYKTDKIIDLASSVKDTNLNTKEIMHIIPVDANGNIVNYLTSDNLKRISKIKIVYKTLEHQEYKVLYDNTYDMVASYRIPSLNLDYNFNHYVIDSNSQVVESLTNYLKGLNYTESLDILTDGADSRIYKDFYNEVTSKELKEFTLKYLSNSNYTNTTNDTLINDYILKAVKENKHIEKALYMYNYLRRFYDLDINGMKLYDFMLFNMEGFDNSLTADKVTNLYFSKSDNFKTEATGTKYAEVLGSYTNQKTIAKFLEYMVTEFGDGNLDGWTKRQFKGYLVEIPIKGMEDKIQYTLWDHFSNEDANYNNPNRSYDMMLPILTLPKNAAYIISTPVQYVIGAERSYIENPDNFKEFDILKRRIQSYADRMSDYFATAYKILEDPKLFNDIHTFHLDKRYAYDENGVMVYQQVGTNEPFHKNFNELLNRWQTSDGNAAVAWGDRIDWSAEGLLDGYIDPVLAKELGKDLQEYTYHTFTHESAHNIDARLFLKNNGRRFDAGGEDYADSNLMQSFGPNDIVMNLSVHYEKGTQIGSNLDPSRIDSPAKVWDYYDKVFETIYVMDYIEAQAFLQLSNEDKAEIGIQVSYPNEDKYKDIELSKYRARQTTGYSQIDAKAWEKMDLKTINDLIDNRIMKYAGVYKYASRGSNSYGGEGINTAHWYQPNNPDGRPDSYALKWIAYEMLGYKGYQDGYIEYNSNIHSVKQKINNDVDDLSKGTSDANFKSDSMALKTITGYTNFDDYKKARFAETADKLPYLKEIKVNDYVQKLYDALVKDAESTRVGLAEKMQKEPNCLDNYWCRVDVVNRRSYPNSTKIRQEIYYTLKDLTNDFQDEIFADTKQQEIKDFKVNK